VIDVQCKSSGLALAKTNPEICFVPTHPLDTPPPKVLLHYSQLNLHTHPKGLKHGEDMD
jgi:hypothetical protein